METKGCLSLSCILSSKPNKNSCLAPIKRNIKPIWAQDSETAQVSWII